MSLIYRAIWRDDRDDILEKSAETFMRWARDKHSPGLRFEPVPATVDGVSTSLLTVENGSIRASVAVMIEETATDRWLTRQRVLVDENGEQWIWVDVERTTSEVFRRQDISAPRFVRTLLDDGNASGGSPRIGRVALRSKAHAIEDSAVESVLIPMITDPERLAPIVVYSHDQEVEVGETMARATTTQEILAGLVQVVVLPPPSERRFVSLLGRDLAVWGGAARLYLPGDMNPGRHRYFLPSVVGQHPREIGRRISRLLSGTMAARRAPEPYKAIKPLLQGAPGKSTDELLAMADQEIAERDRLIEELRTDIELREQELFDRAVDLDEIEDRLAIATRMAKYWMSRAVGNGSEADGSGELPDVVTSLSEAARMCQIHLPRVSLPDGALRDLDELDAAPESSGWSKASWRAFKALAAYAEEAATTNGGFWEWCKNSGHPDAWPASPKKLSMSESESVMSNRAQRAARTLPVSLDLDPSGVLEMQAHIKIAEGGGTDIPRIYFFDDTKGRTGKIHVGFFGPHRYMENTKT